MKSYTSALLAASCAIAFLSMSKIILDRHKNDLCTVDGNYEKYIIEKIKNQCWIFDGINNIPDIDDRWYGYNINAVNKNNMIYTWTAAMNGQMEEKSQGVCPYEWHVPSDYDWTILELRLGLPLSQVGEYGGRYHILDLDRIPSIKQEMPGVRRFDGSFSKTGSFKYYWSLSQNSKKSRTITRHLIQRSSAISREDDLPINAYSVACVKYIN